MALSSIGTLTPAVMLRGRYDELLEEFCVQADRIAHLFKMDSGMMRRALEDAGVDQSVRDAYDEWMYESWERSGD